MRSALVLGAGMAGVSAALHLQRRGWSVALVDRTGPGLETSYGNAGIIQTECVEPHPMPRDLATLFAIATGQTNILRYDLLSLPQHLRPLLSYWWHSAPQRHHKITDAYATIIRTATNEHQVLMEAAGVTNLAKHDGFRVLHRTEAALEAALNSAEHLKKIYGVAYKSVTPQELLAAEPALKFGGVGGLHWLDPWPVSDPGALVQAYADLFVQSGGTFVSGDAASLQQTSGKGWRVVTDNGPMEAAHAVVSLGPWSERLMRGFGYDFPMVRKRGYHKHYRAPVTFNLPLMDAANGYLMAPMSRGLRITTGAELTYRHAPATPHQLDRAEELAGDLIELGAPVENAPWLGTRPCMPDMLPVIGEVARHKGLWMHFGHGHQGFTLGPTTGRMLAEMMDGETPFIPAAPFRPERWAR